MTKADLIVERGARRLQELANRAAARGDGVGEWLAEELAGDAAFLRKLKPSLIAARARGQASNGSTPAASPPPPPGPRARRKPKGPTPLLVVGVALVAGIVLAKVVDWKGRGDPGD